MKEQCDHCDGQGGHGYGYDNSRNLPCMCGWCDGKGFNIIMDKDLNQLRCDYCGRFTKNPKVVPDYHQTLALDPEYNMICKKCDDQRPKGSTVF